MVLASPPRCPLTKSRMVRPEKPRNYQALNLIEKVISEKMKIF